MSPERRQHPRFRLKGLIPAAIETAYTRYTGKIQDLSASGFLLPIAGQLYRHQSSSGEEALAEFMVGNTLVKATGRLARIDENAVGMRLDAPLDPELFRAVIQGTSGAVQWSDSHVRVLGAFNTTVLRDIMQGIRAGKILDLSKVSSMDSSGLGIAHVVLDRKGRIEGCNQIVQPFMATAGVCQRCRGKCLGSPRD